MLSASITLAAPPARANVITDWDEKAIAVVTQMSPFSGQRAMGMVHVAMFDAVNSIERRYKPYLVQLPADTNTSKEAAAASAAATILAAVDPKTAAETKLALASYLASIPDGATKTDGTRLGGEIAARVLDARANDGADAPDAYRPRTAPGVYVPTAITAGSTWPNLKPFVLVKQSQFRPGPPVALKSKEWARDYNEVKDYGGNASTKRSPEQTETARFWLMVGSPAYHPFARKIAIARQMGVAESARFMALTAVALNDAIVAVFDAK